MDQQQLSNRLEERVADVPVGAPPIDAMRSAVRRRRNRMTVLGAAAAVTLVVGGGLVIQSIDTNSDPQPPVVAADPPADPDAPPAGYRYVGIGTAVIAVPESWSTNEIQCSTPQEDTVVIDQSVFCTALFPRPAGIESVEVRSSPSMPPGAKDWSTFDLDGQPALRSPVSQSRASVFIPGLHALFMAESSSAGADAIVEDLLDGIAILRDHTTVPGFSDLALEPGPRSRAIDPYAARLEAQGLVVEVVTEQSDLYRGTVLSTDPAVGSVVAPGDTVTVTVAR